MSLIRIILFLIVSLQIIVLNAFISSGTGSRCSSIRGLQLQPKLRRQVVISKNLALRPSMFLPSPDSALASFLKSFFVALAWTIAERHSQVARRTYMEKEEETRLAKEKEYDEDEFILEEMCESCGDTFYLKCDQCKGMGFFVEKDAIPRKCSACKGLGNISCPDCDPGLKSSVKRNKGGPIKLPPSTAPEL